MEKIKELRKRAMLTQQQVADALNVSRISIVHWEQGESSPRIGRLKKLASILRCEPADLLPSCGTDAVQGDVWE